MAARRLAAAASSPSAKRREVGLDDGVDDVEISGRSSGRRDAAPTAWRRRDAGRGASWRRRGGGAGRNPQAAGFGDGGGADHGGAGVMGDAVLAVGERVPVVVDVDVVVGEFDGETGGALPGDDGCELPGEVEGEDVVE